MIRICQPDQFCNGIVDKLFNTRFPEEVGEDRSLEKDAGRMESNWPMRS